MMLEFMETKILLVSFGVTNYSISFLHKVSSLVNDIDSRIVHCPVGLLVTIEFMDRNEEPVARRIVEYIRIEDTSTAHNIFQDTNINPSLPYICPAS